MGTELKMNKVFKSKLQPEHLRVKSTPVRESCDDSVKPHEVICHAVNNHDRLIEELEQLRKERDELKAQNLVQAWDAEKLLVVMQSYYIEMAKGNQKAANAWIVNTLFGPGLIPEVTEVSAQEFFDKALENRIETMDQARAKLNQD